MSEKLKSRKRTPAALSVGRKVYVQFGTKKRLVRIIEDRGNIGRGGRRLLRVAFTLTRGEPEEAFEIPADEVIQPRPRKNRSKVAVP